jgi:hypothetical protein
MPALAMLIVAAAYGVFSHELLGARGHEISHFVVAGGPGVDPAKVPPSLKIIPGIGGYDGIAFYRLSLDPFTREETAYGIKLDNPAYRQQRIGYPLIVWLLSLGQVAAVPWLLVAFNYAAAILIALFGTMLARARGAHPLWGMTFAFYPGFLMSLSRDTCEIVACAFAIAAFVALGSRRHIAAAVLLSLALLTRETSLMLVIALAAAYLFAKLRRAETYPAFVVIVPVVVYVAWQLTLRAIWGILPLQAGSPDLVFPFSEYLHFFAASLPRRIHLQRLYFAECVFLAAAILAGLVAVIRKQGAPSWLRFAWLGHLAVAATLPRDMWQDDFSFLRVFADLGLVNAAVSSYASRTLRLTLMLAHCALWYYLALHVIEAG